MREFPWDQRASAVCAKTFRDEDINECFELGTNSRRTWRGLPSIFRDGLADADAECGGDLLRLRDHHAGFAGHGDELKTFLNTAVRLRRIGDVNPRGELIFLRRVQDVRDGI